MTVGELFDGGPEQAAALTATGHLVFDWELIAAPWTAAAFAGAHRAARASVRTGRLADGRAVEPRPAAPRVAPRRPSAGTTTTDAIAKAAAVLLLDAARDAVPVLRRGDRDGRRRDPAGRDRRPAGAPREPGLPVVEPRPVPDADAVDRRAGRRVHDRPAVAAARRRTRPAGTSRPRPPTRRRCCRATGACSRRAGRVVALRRGSYEPVDAGDAPTSSPGGGRGRGSRASSSRSTSRATSAAIAAAAPDDGAARRSAATHLDPPAPDPATAVVTLRPLEGRHPRPIG